MFTPVNWMQANKNPSVFLSSGFALKFYSAIQLFSAVTVILFLHAGLCGAASSVAFATRSVSPWLSIFCGVAIFSIVQEGAGFAIKTFASVRDWRARHTPRRYIFSRVYLDPLISKQFALSDVHQPTIAHFVLELLRMAPTLRSGHTTVPASPPATPKNKAIK